MQPSNVLGIFALDYFLGPEATRDYSLEINDFERHFLLANVALSLTTLQKVTIALQTKICVRCIIFLHIKVQWCALENHQSPFYVVNEVTLTEQNPSLKFY